MAGPGLYHVHRLLIASAMGLGAVFALYSAATYRSTGQPLSLALCGLSAATAVALGLYLRWFLRRAGR